MRLLALLTAVLGALVSAQPSAAASNAPCDVTGAARIVAVGDVHGSYDGFLRILRAAKVIDARERWIGGVTHLVQTGDVLDRGAESRKVLDLLRKLEREAPRRGGRVVALIGNHEVMRMIGDYRDMNPEEVASFRTIRSTQIRDDVRRAWLEQQRLEAEAASRPFDEQARAAQFDQEMPLGMLEMMEAFGPRGEYGKWLRARPAVARVNGIVFLHGGISADVAPRGCAGINGTIHRELTDGFEDLRKAPLAALATSEDGPLWYRGLALEEEAAFAPALDGILNAMDARAIVVGHTVAPEGRIRARFGGRVVQIDTGMLTSVYKGGRPSALEIVGDRWTAVYEDGTKPLVPRGSGDERHERSAVAVAAPVP